MYYLCSENKGTDQLRGNCAADMHLCFHIFKKLVSHDAAQIIIGVTVRPMSVSDSHLYITLRYRTELILEKLITNEHGCRIYHGNHEQYIQEFQQEEFRDTVSGVKCKR